MSDINFKYFFYFNKKPKTVFWCVFVVFCTVAYQYLEAFDFYLNNLKYNIYFDYFRYSISFVIGLLLAILIVNMIMFLIKRKMNYNVNFIMLIILFIGCFVALYSLNAISNYTLTPLINILPHNNESYIDSHNHYHITQFENVSYQQTLINQSKGVKI